MPTGKNARTITEFRLRQLCAHVHSRRQENPLRLQQARLRRPAISSCYMINMDGSGLEQVTDFGGFTSFPEFSPDGKRLVFCSDRDAKERYEFNIFVADWR